MGWSDKIREALRAMTPEERKAFHAYRRGQPKQIYNPKDTVEGNAGNIETVVRTWTSIFRRRNKPR